MPLACRRNVLRLLSVERKRFRWPRAYDRVKRLAVANIIPREWIEAAVASARPRSGSGAEAERDGVDTRQTSVQALLLAPPRVKRV